MSSHHGHAGHSVTIRVGFALRMILSGAWIATAIGLLIHFHH